MVASSVVSSSDAPLYHCGDRREARGVEPGVIEATKQAQLNAGFQAACTSATVFFLLMRMCPVSVAAGCRIPRTCSMQIAATASFTTFRSAQRQAFCSTAEGV